MIPDYLIIEEQRRKERELHDQPQQIPLQIPVPMHDFPLPPPTHEPQNTDVSERGVLIIDLNTYETTRI